LCLNRKHQHCRHRRHHRVLVAVLVVVVVLVLVVREGIRRRQRRSGTCQHLRANHSPQELLEQLGTECWCTLAKRGTWC